MLWNRYRRWDWVCNHGRACGEGRAGAGTDLCASSGVGETSSNVGDAGRTTRKRSCRRLPWSNSQRKRKAQGIYQCRASTWQGGAGGCRSVPLARDRGVASGVAADDAGGGNCICHDVAGVGGAKPPEQSFCERDFRIDGRVDPAAAAVGRHCAFSRAHRGFFLDGPGGRGGPLSRSGVDGEA